MSSLSRIKRYSETLVRMVASRWFLVAIFLWFSAQAIFFAISTPFAIPPDERQHLGLIELFIHNHFSPFVNDQEGYYWLGEAIRSPFYLYHYLLSFPYSLVDNWQYGYIFIRLINVSLGVLTIYFLVKIAQQLRISRFATNIGLVMLTCTLMYTFLFAGISYDNLFVLLSIASIYLLLRYARETSFPVLISLLIVLCAGLLVKVTFIPVAAIVGVTLLVIIFRKFRVTITSLRKSFLSRKVISVVLIISLLISMGLMIERYGINLIRYHTYAPGCEQVLTTEECRENALFVRNEYIYETNKRPATKNFVKYTVDWIQLITQRTYGVFAHKELPPSQIILNGIVGVWLLALFAVILRRRKTSRALGIVLLLSALYCLIVLIENYLIYLKSGRATLAVHGRYLFAALPILYLGMGHYLEYLSKNAIFKAVVTIIIVGVFFAGSLPFYLLAASPNWYIWGV